MKKCSNIHCPHGHYDEHATQPCAECKQREGNFWTWLDGIFTNTEKQERAKKIKRDNDKHRKGGEE